MIPKFKVGDVIILRDMDVWKKLEITNVKSRLYEYNILASNWGGTNRYDLSTIDYIDTFSRKLTKLERALR